MNGNTNVDIWAFSGNTAHDIIVVNNPAYTNIANCRMGSSSPIWVDATSGLYYNNTKLQIALNNN